MGKNQGGGNKQKGKKNHVFAPKAVPIEEVKPDNITTFIAKAVKNNGNRFEVETWPTFDKHSALVPGSFKNKVWIKLEEYLLIQFEAGLSGCNCYIIHKYDNNELYELEKLGLFKVALKTKNDDDEKNSNIIFSDNVKKSYSNDDMMHPDLEGKVEDMDDINFEEI